MRSIFLLSMFCSLLTAPILLGEPARAHDAIYASGMVCNGSTDDTAAFNAAISQALQSSLGSQVQIPAGRCILASTISFTLANNQAIQIQGEGRDITELQWNGSGDGMVVTYSSGANYTRDANTGAVLHISDLSIIKGTSGVAGRGLAVLGDTRNNLGIVQPGTTVTNVEFRGTSNSGGWSTNLLLKDTANTSVNKTLVICANGNAPLAANGIGLSYQTTATTPPTLAVVATAHSVSDFSEWGCDHGIDIGSGIQGIVVGNSNFTGGNIGLSWVSVGQQESLGVVNSQFSNLSSGVNVSRVQQVQIVNSVFYNQNAYTSQGHGTPQSWSAINLAEVPNSTITGNAIQGVGTTVGAQESGITWINDPEIHSDQPSVITGNTISNLNGAVLNARNALTNLLVNGNVFDLIAQSPPVTLFNQGGVVDVKFGTNNWSNTLYFSGYPGSSKFTSFVSNTGNLTIGTLTLSSAGNLGIPGSFSAGAANVGALSVTGNVGGSFTPIGNGSIVWNYANGLAEIDFTNNVISGAYPRGFSWYQANTAGVLQQLARLDGSGNFSVVGGLTSSGILNLQTCPTSASSLPSGSIWCNGNVVTRVP